VKQKVPAFCFTNTYQKKRFSKHPRIVTYVDGPFYPDETLPLAQQKKKLRDEIYETMTERSKLSTVQWIEYRKEGADT
jgi:hypothetical protein